MSKLHNAAREGDLATLRRLLDAGADLEARDEKFGHTPLMVACLSPRCGVEALRFLLDRGADVHAGERPETPPARQKPRYKAPADTAALIELAVKNAEIGKLRLLIERGARVDFVSSAGSSLLTIAAYRGREDVIELLVEAGAPLDTVSDYGESALSVLSRCGRFGAVGRLLDAGADPAPLRWDPLLRATALGTPAEMVAILEGGADLETRDSSERTPLLLAIHAGDTEKISLLLDRGASNNATGHCEKPPMFYPLDLDDAATMEWLIERGFDLHQEDEFGDSAISEAVNAGAAACFRVLVAHGAHWRARSADLMSEATHPEIIRQLVALGGDPARLPYEALRAWVGLETSDELAVSRREFLEGRSHAFGTTNPQRMRKPFWDAMVRCGWDAYQAANQFDAPSPTDNKAPVWCHRRFGMSLTALPDGRFAQIAGEHEDHYDPDFCIYNDVIVHDGQGGFEIFGYPRKVFPPTDFHSATLVGGCIYVIGRLGYPSDRRIGDTPVYRLELDTWKIESVRTTGSAPGWIHAHRATLEDDAIRVSGGKVVTLDASSAESLDTQTRDWVLDLRDFRWREIPPA